MIKAQDRANPWSIKEARRSSCLNPTCCGINRIGSTCEDIQPHSLEDFPARMRTYNIIPLPVALGSVETNNYS
jgi:hypothetical protein